MNSGPFGASSSPWTESFAALVAAGPVTELPFDPQAIDAQSDAEIDALPHGVIALDARGTVLRYNLAEARLARLDRHSVLGRDFFTEVAPCTRTAEFEGVFRELVASGAERAPRFAYLFDFQFGAQVCDVEIVKAASAKRFYVFVTRRDFLDARGSLPSGWAAPLQAELDPDGGVSDGVLRDSAEQRVLRVDADFVASFLATAREHYPLAWPRLCHDWGVRYGRRMMVALEMECAEARGSSLAELPFLDTIEILRRKLATSGWGSVAVDTALADEGLVVVEVWRSLLREIAELGRVAESGLGSPLFEGLLSAVFTHLSGRSLVAVELPAGERGCAEFVVLASSLRPFVVTAVQSGLAKTPRELLTALRATMEELRS